MSRQQYFVTESRIAARKIVQGINELKALQREWDALNYGDNLANGEGDNVGIAAADVGAVVHATQSALETLLSAGHATNLHKIL
jgi:hypothetical protein